MYSSRKCSECELNWIEEDKDECPHCMGAAAWFEIEKRAIVGDREAVECLVTCSRRFREAARLIIRDRYGDGFADLNSFVMEVEEIGDFAVEAVEEGIGGMMLISRVRNRAKRG